MKGFRSERSMGSAFCPKDSLGAAFGYAQWAAWHTAETKGLFGVPDHLVVFWKDDRRGSPFYRAVACELKRKHWKRALVQAFRYKAFAHYSIVVMDQAYVHRACKSYQEFRTANVGLAALRTDGSLEWWYRPRYQAPYSEPMSRILHDALARDVFAQDAAPRQCGTAVKWSVR